jgi:hypothetical protein
MKKPSLFASPTPAASISHESEIGNEPRAATKRPPSREGKRVLSIYLPPEAWKQLRMFGGEPGDIDAGSRRGRHQHAVREASAKPDRLTQIRMPAEYFGWAALLTHWSPAPLVREPVLLLRAKLLVNCCQARCDFVTSPRD